VLVRRGALADLAAIRGLMAEVDEFHREALPWLFRRAEGAADDDELADFVSKPEHAAFVAEPPSGGLAGALLVLIRSPRALSIVRRARIAEIDALAVTRAFQRQGVGTALVRAALAWAREQGATRSELGVYEFNERARSFWASVGFETLSRRMKRNLDDA
jgi:GNAT superfamily N-acetyltransferase